MATAQLHNFAEIPVGFFALWACGPFESNPSWRVGAISRNNEGSVAEANKRSVATTSKFGGGNREDRAAPVVSAERQVNKCDINRARPQR